MDITRRDIRLLLLHEFRLGHKSLEAVRNICVRMGEDAHCYNTAKCWFQRFCEGNFYLEGEPHQSRLSAVDLDLLKNLVEEEPRSTLRDLAEQLKCSHGTVANHLHELGKAWKNEVRVPHNLSPSQRQFGVDICLQHLSFHRNFDWLRNLITGEKWICYVNHRRKRQWFSPGRKTYSDAETKKKLLNYWAEKNYV